MLGSLLGGLLLLGQLIPQTPHRYVTDTVHLLAPKVRAALDARLEAYEIRTKHQVFIFITDSSNGEPHHKYALRNFNAWGIGRAGKDDGVLLTIFTKDDMRWITVGYGLEAALSDREATRICREVIAPRMRAHHPNEAIADGVEVILVDIDTWEKR